MGVDSAALAELADAIHGTPVPILSLLISRDDKLVFELYTSSIVRDDAHYLMSVTIPGGE